MLVNIQKWMFNILKCMPPNYPEPLHDPVAMDTEIDSSNQQQFMDKPTKQPDWIVT